MIHEEKEQEEKEEKCSTIIPLPDSLSSLLSSPFVSPYVLIIDHHLLFLFDHAYFIDKKQKNEKLFNNEDYQNLQVILV